jgi:hypothetical protein
MSQYKWAACDDKPLIPRHTAAEGNMNENENVVNEIAKSMPYGLKMHK